MAARAVRTRDRAHRRVQRRLRCCSNLQQRAAIQSVARAHPAHLSGLGQMQPDGRIETTAGLLWHTTPGFSRPYAECREGRSSSHHVPAEAVFSAAVPPTRWRAAGVQHLRCLSKLPSGMYRCHWPAWRPVLHGGVLAPVAGGIPDEGRRGTRKQLALPTSVDNPTAWYGCNVGAVAPPPLPLQSKGAFRGMAAPSAADKDECGSSPYAQTRSTLGHGCRG